eukprot:TRINITY_DN42180_c0_g1_i1.p1 TRINITY_DN42180_c0_g1~~TRINITY_DN42180_c0_g1_i1.p1  ORF type:complete len:222 (-),score=23.94 TRINITY_DN42180_c0_g1_i1:226-891(-)
MAACVLLANIYMNGFDILLQDQLMEHCSHYGRLVDAAFATDLQHDQLLPVPDGWNKNIVWESMGSGQSIDFLDLTLSIDAHRRLSWTMYIPMTSAHPPQTFAGFVRSEHIRIMRRCRTPGDCLRQNDVFADKLRDRGYPVSFIKKHKILDDSARGRSTKRLAFLRLRFSRQLGRRCLMNKLKLGSKRLRFMDMRLAVSWRVGRNLFRRYCANNWLYNPSRR